MKILKLLVTSVLMSAMLISCTDDSTTTTTTTATTETDSAQNQPAQEATPEVEEEATEEEANEETDAVSYFHADMTDEEITEAYTQQLNDMVEAGDIEEDAVEVMLSIFDPATIRATLAGEEVEVDVDSIIEATEEEATEEEATEESAAE